MVQEIITYLIVGSAVIVSAIKITKRLSGTSKAKRGTSKHTAKHNCSACTAECQLRGLPRSVIQKNAKACAPVKEQSELFQS